LYRFPRSWPSDTPEPNAAAALLLVAALALVAAFLLYWAITRARKHDRPTKRRVGDALGFSGLGIGAATLAASVAFDFDGNPVPMIAFGLGVVLAGIGGTMASWRRH
jgi:hypothetical protein